MAKSKLKPDPSIAEWHGAPNQIRRIIDGIISNADEAHAEASANPNTETLVEYIVSVNILFSNVESILPAGLREQLRRYMDDINRVRWKMPKLVDRNFYYKLMQSANWLDRKLRDELQGKKLLFKVGRDKQYASEQSIRDAQKYMDEDTKKKMAQQFPTFASYFQEADTQDSEAHADAGDQAPSGSEDISDDEIEFEDTEQQDSEEHEEATEDEG